MYQIFSPLSYLKEPSEFNSLLLVFNKHLAKEDQVGFNAERTLESSEEDDAPGFSSSIVQEHSKSDEVSEIVGDCVPESNIERDLSDNRMSSHQLSATPALVSLDDTLLTPSATTTLEKGFQTGKLGERKK